MPKILINLDRPVMDLSDGEDAIAGMKPTTEKLSKTLGTMLKADPNGDALKFLGWAMDLYQKGRLEVDESDFKVLYEFVERNKQAWALVKGQLLRAFTEAKEAASKPAEASPVT